ncbi:GtrA family protein [Psychrobacter urativorans]|uniref:GtrA family protein n=1 Tax=Psychrobacter urativorans TaxID=45610 RepID=UPI0019189475|nr:GtrA family protein [Psychrobacter urativorans]
MNKIAITQSASQQALWFLAVGASAALVHFLILISVVNFTTVSPAWANVVAFLIAFIVSFFGHFYLTFSQSNSSTDKHSSNNDDYIKNRRTSVNKTPSSWRHSLPILLKWFASSLLGFIANQSLFVLGLSWFGELYYIIIWLVVTGVITVMTFALGKLWAFKS